MKHSRPAFWMDLRLVPGALAVAYVRFPSSGWMTARFTELLPLLRVVIGEITAEDEADALIRVQQRLEEWDQWPARDRLCAARDAICAYEALRVGKEAA